MKVLPHTKDEVETVEHAKEDSLRKFFKEVQPDDGADKYLIDVMSSIVFVIRTNNFFLIFQGGGSNGKTMIELLLIPMLGEYCVTPDIKLLTGKGGMPRGQILN